MDSDRKRTKFIVKLTKLTKDKEIEWSSIVEDIQLENEGEIIDKVYYTEVKGKYFRVYKFRVKIFYEEDMYFWSKKYHLEIVDRNKYPEWTFPEETSIKSLYETIRYQVANVDDIVDDILNNQL